MPRRRQAAPEDNTERAWRAGLDAMAKRRWPDAVRAFRTAHSAVIDRPDFMAHLGWAIFNDTAPGSARVEEALELLELAESFDERAALTQLWLATVEAHAQRLSRARARRRARLGAHPPLRRLQRRGEGSPRRGCGTRR